MTQFTQEQYRDALESFNYACQALLMEGIDYDTAQSIRHALSAMADPMWQHVLKEPTEEMIKSTTPRNCGGFTFSHDSSDKVSIEFHPERIWSSMLAACPPHATQTDQREG